MKPHGPYLIQDRVRLALWCAPANGERHGSWQASISAAKEFKTKVEAEATLAGIKHHQSPADRWRNAIVPLSELSAAFRQPDLITEVENHAQR